MLRRVWLSSEDEEGYYYGCANGALWPLCHIAYARPEFNDSDWAAYTRVNRRFADTVLQEIAPGPAIVFVQDYHFALLPRFIKDARPDVIVCQFWHIPWPNPEAFQVCPWGEQILHGLLGNDLLSFHIQQLQQFPRDRGADPRVARRLRALRRRPRRPSDGPAASDQHRSGTVGRTDQAVRPSRGGSDARWASAARRLIFGVDRLDYTKAFRIGCARSSGSSIVTRNGASAWSSFRSVRPAASRAISASGRDGGSGQHRIRHQPVAARALPS